MSTRTDIINMLSKETNRYISGQEMAEKLGLSRNAVWKTIEKLKEEGLPIESKARAGYKLSGDLDILAKDIIAAGLDFACNVLVEETVTSTSDVAQKLFDGKSPLLVVANAQTNGRGRMGRSFYSPANTGIYMSYAFKPEIGFDKSSLITLAAAVAVAQAMEEVCKKSPKVKWVNDLYLNNKKVGGIITNASMSLEGGQIDSLVIGIGLNCFTKDFPEMERNVPGSIETDVKYSRSDLIAAIANKLNQQFSNMDSKNVIFEYKTRCNTLGKPITIFKDYNNPNEVGVKARAYDIDDNGGLIVEYQSDLTGQFHTITSGEITIREV